MKTIGLFRTVLPRIIHVQKAQYSIFDKINPFKRFQKAKETAVSLSKRIDDARKTIKQKSESQLAKDEYEKHLKEEQRKDMYPPQSYFPKLKTLDFDDASVQIEFYAKRNLVVFIYSELASEHSDIWIKKYTDVFPETNVVVCFAYKPSYITTTFSRQILKQLKKDTENLDVDLKCACFEPLPFNFGRKDVAIFLTDRNAMIRFQTFGEWDEGEFNELLDISKKI